MKLQTCNRIPINLFLQLCRPMFQNKTAFWVIPLTITGIVFFSAKAVIVKMAYAYEIDAIPLLLLRMGFALPVYAVMAILKRPTNPDQIVPKDYIWIVVFGFIGYYLASLFDFLGLIYIKASLERIILFVYPTLVVFMSWLAFKKKVNRVQVIAILISYLGIIITFSGELELSGNKDDILLGGFLVFLSAVTYAGYLVGSGWLIPKFGATTFTSYAMIVSSVCVLIHYGLTQPFDLLLYPTEVYVLGFSMAMISTVIPSYLVSISIKHMGASTFSIFGSLGPISTIVLANLFLDERLTVVQTAGAMVVIIGVVIVTRAKH